MCALPARLPGVGGSGGGEGGLPTALTPCMPRGALLCISELEGSELAK